MNIRAKLAALIAACALLLPAAASAQSYERELTGRVIDFHPYNLQLTDGPHIFLHDGTVIHPTGLTLQNGMFVRVYGHYNGYGAFSADEIDLVRPYQRY